MPSGILRTEDDVLKYIKNMDYEKECEKTRIMIKEKTDTFWEGMLLRCVW